MFKVEKVEVLPRRDKFGIEHRLFLSGDTEALKSLFERFLSAQSFSAEGKHLEIVFNPQEVVRFELEKPLEDYYTDDVHTAWKEMVAEALGMEEPFRYYSFYSLEGRHLGTVGFKQDCENLLPIITVYKNF